MRPILSSSKALAKLFSCKGRFVDSVWNLESTGRFDEKFKRLERFSLNRCFGSSSGIWKLVDSGLGCNPASSSCGLGRNTQRRLFLGCGDGEEGGALSKTHEERVVLGYSPEKLFAVVAAVDLYEDFLPWCRRSKIMRHNSDGSFDAELEIGFKFLVESYVSHVVLKKPKYIKTTVSQSALFDHLINVWEFNPGPVPGSCDVHFLVDFRFQSPLYSQVASVFFKEVVSRLVYSFTDRCRRIYGPAVRVIESAYGQAS